MTNLPAILDFLGRNSRYKLARMLLYILLINNLFIYLLFIYLLYYLFMYLLEDNWVASDGELTDLVKKVDIIRLDGA